WIEALRLDRLAMWICTLLSTLALTGLLFALWRSTDQAMPLALAAIVLPIPYYLTHSSLRYRHPIDPVLTILAVYAVFAVSGALLRTKAKATSDSSVGVASIL